MPELPDVELIRRDLNARALRRRIRTVQVHDRAILKGVTPGMLLARLKGRAFKSTRRHGKHLFVEISTRRQWLRFHFGMTGSLVCLAESGALPRHTRIVFQFGRTRLVFVDQRKFGAIGLVAAMADYLEEKNLGPDALQIGERQFAERLADRHGAIKVALMDQQIIAGLGNLYADEALFHARINPKARLGDLGPSRLKKIYQTMKLVLAKAVACEADAHRFPAGWMLRRRHRNGKCPRCGRQWKWIKVASRTTCFCPRCQQFS